MNGRRTDIKKTSQVVKNLLWRWVRYQEGIAPAPLTKYEEGMIVVNSIGGAQWIAGAEL